MTSSVVAAHAQWAELVLFVWVLANQGGVPIAGGVALLGAGALAGSGSLSVGVILAVSVAAALCADLTWYLLGRWRGSRALNLLTRLVPKARTHVQCASHLLLAHERVFQLIARFLPVVNPIAAGLAGAAGMSVSRFLPGAAVSAAVWAGSWIGIGYLLTHGVAGLARSFALPLTFVVIIATLVGWRLLTQAPPRFLLHTMGRARARRGSRVARRSPSSRWMNSLFVFVIAALAAGCGDTSRAAGSPPLPAVEVEAVAEQDVPIYGEWVGTTVGYVTAQIRARVSGYLMRQNYKEGTLVKAGDVLFEIDSRTYEFAERQARAALLLAESQLEQSKAQVAQAEADLARAEATQKRSELDVARYAPLAGTGAVTQQEVDNAVQTDAANVAMVKAGAANVANAKAGVTRTQADIERLRAALADAQLNIGWTKIISPITGIAGIKNANIGDLIEPSTPLTTVSQLDPIYVQIAISEQEYLRWSRRGATERLRDLGIILADGTTYPHRGTAVILDREVGRTTGTINLRGVFPNPGELLRPGQFVKVRAAIDLRKNALLIPQRAVQNLQDIHQVAVIGADETVDVRTVQVGQRVGSLWIVEQGLKPGERVVVEGLDKVRAGAKVKPTVAETRQPSAHSAHGPSK